MYFFDNINNVLLVVALATVVVAVIVIVLALVLRRRKKRAHGQHGAGDDARKAASATTGEQDGDARTSAENGRQGGQVGGRGAGGVPSASVTSDFEALLDEPEFESAAQRRARDVASAFNSQTRYVSLDVPSACGFNFNRVVASYSTRHGEGAYAPRAQTVYAQDRNFDKIKADLGLLQPLFAALTSQAAQSFYHAVFPDIEGMIALLRPFGQRSVAIRGAENLALITVERPDAAGAPAEFPVTVRAVTVRHGQHDGAHSTEAHKQDSLVVDLCYLPNGSIRKGRIVRWHNRTGYLCEFEWDGFSANYLPTVVKVTDNPGVWRTVFGE